MVRRPLCVTFVGSCFHTSMHGPEFNSVWIIEASFSTASATGQLVSGLPQKKERTTKLTYMHTNISQEH